MISHFRNFARSKWAAVLLVLVALSLLVTGAQMDVFSSLGPKHVISAGDRSVDQAQFRSDFERVRSNLQDEAQRPVTLEEMIAENIHVRYLDGQTERLGFLAWAWDAGIRPGKELVLKQIRKVPAFFNSISGQFDEEAYTSALASQNVTPAMVEQDFRDQYVTNHFATAMFAGARLPRIYGALVAGQVLEARDGRWFAVTQAMVGAAPAPTDAQLSTFMRENAAQLRQPEFRTASVVLFNSEAGSAAPISDARILERFNFRKDALSEPETRTFVTLTAPTRAVADRIAAALRAGQTPAQAGAAASIEPAAYSDTPRTALGDPAVAAAVFGLTANQVSDPVQGRVGFTVAQVTAITPGQEATLAGVRDAIVEELRGEDARTQVYERVEKYEQAREAGRTVTVAAQEVGARIQQLVPFTQDGKAPNGQALPYPPQIFTTAWGLSKGGESEVIDAGGGQYFVLRLDDIRAAALPTLAEVREPLAAQWIARENSRRLSAKAEELAGQVRAGQDIAAVAARAGAALTTRTGVQANQQTATELGQGLLQGLFGQGRGQIFVQPTSQTAFVVGRVDQIRAPTAALAAPIGEQQRPRMTQELANAMIETLAGAGAARSKARSDVALALQAIGVEAPGRRRNPGCTHPRAMIPSGGRNAFGAGWSAGRPQVVVRRLVDDLETPVSAFLKVGHGRPYAMLLESVEGGAVNGRYSIIARDPDTVWRCRDGQAEIASGSDVAAGRFTPQAGGALDSLRTLMAASRFDLPDDLPPMAAGLFGVFGYDMVRLLEPLGPANPDPLDLPDAVLARPSLVAIFDSVRHEIVLVAAAYPDGAAGAASAYDAALARLDAFETELRASLSSRSSAVETPGPAFASPVDAEAFAELVASAKDYIAAGDIFQVVLSHRFSAPFTDDPFAVYRSLRRQNPSPYLFFLNFVDFQLAGSSPEILVRLKDGEVTIRPLAGTRPRGETPETDRALEAELLADPKERAEHLMLLDLGRNDVGRVSIPGTVEVTDSFSVERYSQVMHIVSNVTGRADPALDAVDTLLAALPAGTLSGAPKVRAMAIIDELESEKRGVGYGGGVGYISAGGEADICIVLRTALFARGRIFVQAGAGVVVDSDPAAEYAETLIKAKAPMRAAAEAWRFTSGG